MAGPLRRVRRALVDGLLSLAVLLVLALTALFPPRSARHSPGLSHLLALLGGWVGVLAWPLRRRAEVQVQAALGCSPQASNRIAMDVFAHLGRSIGELLELRRGHRHFPQQASRVPAWVEGADQLLTPLKQGRSVVLLTAHLGNWELLGQVISLLAAQAGARLEVIYRPLPQPQLNRLLEVDRARRGIGLLARGPETTFAQLCAHLEQGPTVLAFLIDQDLRAPGMMVPFFHAPAHTPTTPALLALESSAVLLTAFTWREDGRHEVLIEPLPSPSAVSPADLEASVEALLRTYQARLEALIRHVPDQWVWFHPRWRSSSHGWVPRGWKGLPEQGGLSTLLPTAVLLTGLGLAGCQELPTPVLDRSELQIQGLTLFQEQGSQRITAQVEELSGRSERAMAHERARTSWLGGIGGLEARGVQLETQQVADADPREPSSILSAPLQLEADRMTSTLEGSQVELIGHVRLKLGPPGQEGLVIQAQKLRLRRQEGRIVEGTAEGQVQVFWQGRKAQAAHLTFRPDTQQLELRGSARVEEPGKRLEAERIVLGLADQTLACDGCKVRWEGGL